MLNTIPKPSNPLQIQGRVSLPFPSHRSGSAGCSWLGRSHPPSLLSHVPTNIQYFTSWDFQETQGNHNCCSMSLLKRTLWLVENRCNRIGHKNNAMLKKQSSSKTARIYLKIDEPRLQCPAPKTNFSSSLYYTFVNMSIQKSLKTIGYYHIFTSLVCKEHA